MIRMTAVEKHFGDLHVLRDINLEVDAGQVVVVLGPSGSGKSTLCRTINRLETIDEGTITLDGKDLPQEGKALAALRAEVGMVFQSFNLFAHKTILENVTLGPIKVRGPNNYALDTTDAVVDLKTRRLRSTAAVTGTVRQGTFSGDSMRADLEARTVTLDGNARLRIDPRK